MRHLLLALTTLTAFPNAAALASPASCMDDEHGVFIGTILDDCLRLQAKLLERSGEEANTVATAVVGACRAQKDAWADSFARCIAPTPVNPDFPAKLSQSVHDKAVEYVVEIRAARHPN